MTNVPSNQTAAPCRLWFWRLALTIAGTCAAIWFWIMPGGFPVDHPRFWANRAIPILVLAAAIVARVAVTRKNWTALHAAGLAMASGCTAALAAAVAVFPVSALRVVLPGIVAVGAFWVIYAKTLRNVPALPWRTRIPVVAIAAATAITFVWAQRAPEASTVPIDLAAPDWTFNDPDEGEALVSLSNDVDMMPAAEIVRANFGGLSLTIAPLLTFESRSPDRCWTIVAPRRLRVGPERLLTGFRSDEGVLRAEYLDDCQHWLRVGVDQPGDELTVEAVNELLEPIYSHLNSFTEITIRGHKRLSFSFSPCAATHVEALPADYPNGRPRRLAYLSADGVFRVVEASSGEKGPFVELASGPLSRDAPLVVTLLDGDRPACELAFSDWAAQASVDLSPTAGWGLPANAIEFERLGDSPTADVAIWITLAGTSVGRGWDSVGHRAGVYRNRITVRTTSVQAVPAEVE